MKTIERLFLFCLLLSTTFGFAQESSAQKSEEKEKDDLIQFSGVVVHGDSLISVPFTNIVIANQGRGTMADAQGYFSLVAKENDTIHFSATGFKKSHFIIPDSLKKTNYSLIHTMEKDTVQMKKATVHPWPTKAQFKEAFMNVDLQDDDLERARKNLADARMRRRMENMEMGPSLNFSYKMQEHQNKVYYAGQAPPMSILNPSAWAEFIKAWREGEFTDQGQE